MHSSFSRDPEPIPPYDLLGWLTGVAVAHRRIA